MRLKRIKIRGCEEPLHQPISNPNGSLMTEPGLDVKEADHRISV